MEYKTVRLYDNTWAIEDGGVRIFVIRGSEKALVVDTGFGDIDVIGAVRSLTDLPLELLNTHADRDHVGGNAPFESFYMHPAEAASYYADPARGGEIRPVWEGSVIDLGDRPLEVLHVPGHTPGSVTLLDPAQRCLIGGDPIQEGGRIYMFGPARCMKIYPLGLEHVMERAADFDVVYPSHAKLCVEKSVIPKLIEGALDIMAGKAQYVDEELPGRGVVRIYDAGVSKFLCER